MKKKRKMISSLVLLFLLCMSIPLSVYARSAKNENDYIIYLPEIPLSASFDTRDYAERGIVRVGWGNEIMVALSNELPIKQSEQVVKWDAVLPDGSIKLPYSIYGAGIASFLVPYEMTGIMKIRAYIENEEVATFDVIVVDHYMDGKPIKGWTYLNRERYYILEGGKLAKGWFCASGKWYYMNQDGVAQIGWQRLSYNGKSNWYFFNEDGKMLIGWQRIGNSWYFFKNDGSMAANEWAGGYWLSANGSWKYHPKGTWKHNGKGWWFEDTSGWYPKGETVIINGVTYTFDEKGYLAE